MSNEDKTLINEDSSEWKNTLYQLQMVTGCSSLKLLTLHRYPVLVQKATNDSSIRAIVDTTDLKHHFKSSVIEKRIPLSDVVFICGLLNFNRYHLELKKPFHFLICEVALGNIVPVESDSEFADSLLLQPEPQNDDPFHYNQYRVKYECSFVIGNQIEVFNQPIICSYCGNLPASLYCRNQQKHFCQYCSTSQHRLPEDNRKAKEMRHEIEPINRTNSLPLCENHGYRHEGFCLTCQKYLCPACCQQQLHNQNEDHPVRPLEYLFLEKRQCNARLPIKPRQRLNKIYQVADEKQEELIRNYKRVKQEIMAEYERAMQDLQKIHKQKMILVQTDLIIIQMELERIDWYFTFIKTEEERLKPINYFKLQARLEEEMKHIKSTGFDNSLRVKSDLDHYSFIRVGDSNTIAEIKKSMTTQEQNQNDRQYSSRVKGKESSQELKRVGERMVTYDPAVKPPQKGELNFLLQNTGIHFFKIKRQE